MDIPNTGAIFTLGKSHLAENTQSYFYIKNDPIKRLIAGPHQSAVICDSNEIFFTGHNIFSKTSAVSSNFTEATVNGELCEIIRKPFRLEEFDDCLSNNEETENFINILAGNEHFMVLTSYGRLIGWGSNKSYQLGLSNREPILKPQEILLESPVQQFTCGPESTMVLTQNGNLYLTGHLNDFVFPQFTELQKNLSSNEQIIFMHISKGSDVFIVTNAGSIYRSYESVRTKSLIFQRFYDYDSEENGPIWKILKGASFYAVLTKANKFYTTFSESGHHLKTFREISKFKNLRVVDMALGDRHILVHGIPRSSTMFTTIGSDNQPRYIAQNYGIPITGTGLTTSNSVRSEIIDNRDENVNEINKKIEKREATPEPITPKQNQVLPNIKEEHNDKENIQSVNDNNYQGMYSTTHTKNSPTDSIGSRKSVCSTKTLKKTTSAEKILRPRTPYPDSNTSSSPQSIIRKTPMRTLSYEAAMNEDCLECTSPVLLESLENAQKTAISTVKSSTPNVNISIPTPPTEDDEELTVEISESTDPLDRTMITNEIRFINNGIDVTANVKKQYLVESEHEHTDNENKEDAKGLEIRKQAEYLVNDLENEIEERFEEGKVMKKDTEIAIKESSKIFGYKTVQTTVDDNEDKIETKFGEVKSSLEVAASKVASGAQSTINKVTESSKKTAEEALQSVEDMGNSAAKVTEEGFQALEEVGRNAAKVTNEAKDAMGNALKKAADGTRQAVGCVTSKISTEMQDARNTLTSLLSGKRNKVDVEKQQNSSQLDEEEKSQTELLPATTECRNKSNNSQLTTNSTNGHEDDERTTASANSTHPSANNPFESNNPFHNEVEDAEVKGKIALREELNTVGPIIERQSEQTIDQEEKPKNQPPRYTEEDELALQPVNGRRAGGSKVCTIL
uniref:Uncharacterized protein n=1 Tax=Glossina brevipalpis TaxID=37001 RepID=A0A1A9W770_9MUSC